MEDEKPRFLVGDGIFKEISIQLLDSISSTYPRKIAEEGKFPYRWVADKVIHKDENNELCELWDFFPCENAWSFSNDHCQVILILNRDSGHDVYTVFHSMKLFVKERWVNPFTFLPEEIMNYFNIEKHIWPTKEFSKEDMLNFIFYGSPKNE